MKVQVIKHKRKWLMVLHGLLLAGLAYSALLLDSKPAYAAECDCEALEYAAGEYCYYQYHSWLSEFHCPEGTAPDFFWWGLCGGWDLIANPC